MTAPLIIMIVTFVGYVIAYKTYGRFIAQKLFQLNPNNKVPHILHFAIASVEGDQLFDFLSQYAAFSAGSACRSGNENPSHVLTAMGVEAPIAQKSIRFSFGRYTRQEDITLLIGKLEAFIKTQQAT